MCSKIIFQHPLIKQLDGKIIIKNFNKKTCFLAFLIDTLEASESKEFNMSNLNAIQANLQLGPIYLKKEREQYAPVLSETCSLTDRIFQDASSQQKLNFQVHPWLQPTERLTDYVYTNPYPVKALLKTKSCIREYRGMIREHIERRILFFFQQMIVCHQTKLHFESVGALHQGASASAITMNVKGRQKKYAVRQAAHSCGNPCLVAYDNAQWQQYQKGIIAKPQGFVFLEGTDFYRINNSTMNMPKWINDADREIDEKTTYSKLRAKGEAIINRDSQGLVTPDEGMIEYIQAALDEVDAAQLRLSKLEKDSEVQEVLTYYKKYLKKIQRTVEEDPLFLEKFLNLKLGDATQNEKSKRLILQMRYAAIRNCQINQAALIQKIEGLRQKVLTQLTKENRNRKPDNFDAAFRAVLIEHAQTNEDRQRLEKLLNFSPFNFEAQLQKAPKKKYFNTKTSVATHSVQINLIAKEILEDMNKLRTREMVERGQTIKELRWMKNWTQKELGEEIKLAFPLAAASQSTISRIENKKKLVTQQIATEFSKVFGVDPGLFMPHFYYN